MMSQLLSLRLSLLLTIFTWALSTPSCVFDEIKPHYNDIPKKDIFYQNSIKSQHKRSVEYTALQYRPLRIHSYFYRLDEELTETQEAELRRIVGGVTRRAAAVFSVVPVDGPLVLARGDGACNRVYADGPNKEKCASVRSSYNGETCLDRFPIPEPHLEGLYVWNYTYPLPVHTVRVVGPGVDATDYILYVRAHSTTTCIKPGANIIAYATYCQLDQHNRPIAGYINFCPHLIQSSLSQPDKVSTTALHELFHALGFSADLFPKFQDCSVEGDSLECSTRMQVSEYTWSAHRMVTPRVSAFASDHFSCHPTPSQDRFGPVLHTKDGQVTSHWDSAFMYSSLMTATIGQPRLTVLDNMTLALFEDSGWYQVDYTRAQQFVWGRGGGCQFGLFPDCTDDTSGYFCNSSTVGCHHLHEDQAVCATDDFLHGCSVYKPQCCWCEQTQCVADEESDDQSNHGNHCLLSNLQDASIAVSGWCFSTSCSTDAQLYIRIGETWTLCPWGTTLHNVTGYPGQVECPEEGIICQSQLVTMTTATETTPTSAPPTVSYVSRGQSTDTVFSGAGTHTLQLMGPGNDSLMVVLSLGLCWSIFSLVR